MGRPEEAKAEVKLTLLTAGFCTGPERVVLRGGAHRECRLPALVALIEHPVHGLALFDTGYSERFAAETRRGLARLYAAATPVHYDPVDGVAAQLRARGLDPADVRTVILSHFHADHVAGARDFPRARFVYHDGAYRRLRAMGGVRQLRHAFLAGLLPGDFDDRASMIEALPAAALPYAAFPAGHDVFGDGSVVIVDMPGHALGHVGALVRAADATWLMAADACWLSRAITENRMPSRLAGLLFPDGAAYRRSLGALHRLSVAHPEIRIVPTHCEVAEARWGVGAPVRVPG